MDDKSEKTAQLSTLPAVLLMKIAKMLPTNNLAAYAAVQHALNTLSLSRNRGFDQKTRKIRLFFKM